MHRSIVLEYVILLTQRWGNPQIPLSDAAFGSRTSDFLKTTRKDQPTGRNT